MIEHRPTLFRTEANYIYCQLPQLGGPADFIANLRQALDLCHEQVRRGILMDLTLLPEFSPNFAKEHYTIQTMLPYWDRAVRFAFLASPGQARALNFAVLAASNRGIGIALLTTEEQVREWASG